VTATKTKVRRLPQRTCVTCGSTTNKRELVRIVRTSSPEGQTRVIADPTGKQAGRGAYLCHQPECWETALKKGRLAHSLKTTITERDADALRAHAASLFGGDA
jgi:predicted RNA-binding protein YlxR (DUF448 family)